jgi:hypothetical protein
MAKNENAVMLKLNDEMLGWLDKMAEEDTRNRQQMLRVLIKKEWEGRNKKVEVGG